MMKYKLSVTYKHVCDVCQAVGEQSFGMPIGGIIPRPSAPPGWRKIDVDGAVTLVCNKHTATVEIYVDDLDGRVFQKFGWSGFQA